MLMMLIWIAVIGGIVWLIVYLVRRPGTGSGITSTESALDILNKRYARGEISKDDNERMKREISS